MIRRFLLVVTFVSLGLMAGLVLTGRMQTAEVSDAAPSQAAPEAQPARTAAAPAPAVSGLPDLTNIAQRAIESVTNISSTQVVRSPITNDPFFRFFFREDDLYRERRQQSLGSGVVVSTDGYVLTNHHVVGSAGADVRVGFSDKRELRAKVVGADEWTNGSSRSGTPSS
jgi:serine protease DegS